MHKYPFTFLIVASTYLLGGCAADALPEPVATPCDGTALTYEADIRPIVEQTCAYSGCHLGGAPGVYNGYEGLLPALESGTFRQRVVRQKDNPNVGMPPDYAPEGRPTDLTAEQLQTITCWLEAGYPRE
ncbi:hypothetical protein [Neolewinella antarctica]|uniref:Cytochrome c domain-containing protein n=1 Tax=Neolewinella antarctica TaxID=442734 RepID=A0ABX0XD16_9BACT|nr:hypothetical protein [Neolewinella antarctica]NJC27189.1 hypothetical protein [Neolewinella antarctica]